MTGKPASFTNIAFDTGVIAENERIVSLIPKIVSEIENHEIWGSTGKCLKCGTLGNYRIAHRIEIVTALIQKEKNETV